MGYIEVDIYRPCRPSSIFLFFSAVRVVLGGLDPLREAGGLIRSSQERTGFAARHLTSVRPCNFGRAELGCNGAWHAELHN